MNLIFMGPPGAGKGTQAVEIKDEYNIPHISTGDMFREAMRNETPLGVEAKKFVDNGLLVPDDVTNGIVKERLSQSDCNNGFLLDGFPRTVEQAKALDKMLQDIGKQLDKVVALDVEQDILIERLTGRRMCKDCGRSYHVVFNPPTSEQVCDACGGELYQRKDDNVESAMVRLNEYQNKTQPLFDYYETQGLLVKIDGSKNKEIVFEEIKDVLGGAK